MSIYRLLSVATLAVIAFGSAKADTNGELVSVDVTNTQVAYVDEAPTNEQFVATAAPLDDRFASLEARLSMLESQPVASSSGCNRGPVSSRRLSTNSVGRSTTYAGFELAILKPHVGALSGSLGGPSTTLTETFDFDVSPRVFIGRENCNGVGARATYWQYDHTTDPNPNTGVVTGLEMHALDLEGTFRTAFCGSDVMLTSGIRYANVDLNLGLAGVGSVAYQSEGVGPTLGGQMRRRINSSWNYYLGGRVSILLTDNEIDIPGLLQVEAEESVTQVLELRSGIETRRSLGGNRELVAQLGFEAQNWQAGAIAGLINPDVALYGPSIRLGVNF